MRLFWHLATHRDHQIVLKVIRYRRRTALICSCDREF